MWTLAVLTAYDQIAMSMHSYSRCWIHLIWGTLNREKLLNKTAAARVSRYVAEYAEKEGIYMKINYVNADHVHTLIDLPTALSVEKVMQLLKGASLIGSIRMMWLQENSPGAEGMAHFQYQ